MKSQATALILFLLANLLSNGQDRADALVLTPKDVDPNSVRLATHENTPYQNLVIRLPGRTSEELKAIDRRCAGAQIRKDNLAVVNAQIVWALWDKTGTNATGLILGFQKHADAKLAEQVLRGN